jgi:hypothetical protein
MITRVFIIIIEKMPIDYCCLKSSMLIDAFRIVRAAPISLKIFFTHGAAARQHAP